MEKRKKGVSPVISTVLLIMIVIILAVIILLWANSFVREAITKKIIDDTKTVEEWCKEIDITPEISRDQLSFGFTNNGNVPIYQYELKLTEKDSGDSNVILITSAEGGSVNQGYSSILNSSLRSDIKSYDQYDKIKVIPILLGEGTKSSGKTEFKCPESTASII